MSHPGDLVKDKLLHRSPRVDPRAFDGHSLIAFDTATVQKIITEILPPSSGQTFSKDARDLLMECCVEFITLISSEANDISEKEAKKTIACEHVEKALRDLGFADYIPDVLAVAEDHKEQLKVCPVMSRCAIDQLTGWVSSLGRRSRARWSKVDSLKKSSFGNSRSFSGLLLRSTTRVLNKMAWTRSHAGHRAKGRWAFCVFHGGEDLEFSYGLS